MYRIFMAPVQQPGMLRLQARQGVWEAMLALHKARGDAETAQQLTGALIAAGYRDLKAPGVVPSPDTAETGPVIALVLPDRAARTVLLSAGVSA